MRVSRCPVLAVAATAMLLTVASSSVAAESIPTGSASFALVDEPDGAAHGTARLPPAEPPPSAPPNASPTPTWTLAQTDAPPGYGTGTSGWSTPPPRDRPAPGPSTSDEWMLSLEGVTHAPVDIGLQAVLEFPFGLRLSGGYGWVPSAYLDLIVDAATAASDADPATSTVISNAFESGTAWRIQGGVRPFENVGVYLDAGYSQVRLDGSIDAADIAAAAGVPPGSAGSDTYAVDSTIHLWLIELGYQATIADRLVLGIAAGVMGAIDSSTEATPGSTRPPAQERLLRATATEIVDQQIESYGFLPTVTLRLGFDLI